MKLNKERYETYLVAGTIGIGLVILGLYAFFSFSNYRSIYSQELESHIAVLERASVELEDFINVRLLLLGELASGVSADFSDSAARKEKVSLFLHRYPEFQKIRVVDEAGSDITLESRLETLSSKDFEESAGKPAFDHVKTGSPYIGLANISFEALPSTELAVPINDERLRVKGAVIAELDLRKIWDTVSQIKVGSRGAVYVVDRVGNLVAHPDRQFALTVADLKNRDVIKEILNGKRTLPGITSGQYSNERGEDVFAVARALSFGWGVTVEEPTNEFFEASSSILRLNVIISLATVLLIFFLILGIRSFLKLFRELKEERTEKAEIIANLSDGLIVTDGEGRVMLINARAERLLLLRKDINFSNLRPTNDANSDLGLVPLVFFPQDSPRGIFKNFSPKRELQITTPVELHLEIDTVVIASKERGFGGRILFVFRDVTRERILSRLKSEFISIAAHQLRTPLSAIKWALRLILDGDFGSLTPEQQQYLQSGYETNERMIKLVNDLLNVSRIEEGRFEFNFKEEDPVLLLESLVSYFKEIAVKKKVALAFEKPAGPISPVYLDRPRIEMALQNLMENALAYTPSGGKVKVSIEDRPEFLVISISDTGMGIAPKDRERLFTKFYRSEAAVRTQPGGSGLGLFIAHNIIVGHRGTIEVESEVGKGTKFTIKLSKKSAPTTLSEVEFKEFMKGL